VGWDEMMLGFEWRGSFWWGRRRKGKLEFREGLRG